MRNWNPIQAFHACKGNKVFTVPMRNWNFCCFIIKTQPYAGFYSTYEELKLKTSKRCSSLPNWFLQYLWGIETYFTTYEFTCFYKVFTVPMRNWNKPRPYSGMLPTWVFTVPMRNWNSRSTNLVILLQPPVFTVPMRNWNILTWPQPHLSWSTFLQYLWGIETELVKILV